MKAGDQAVLFGDKAILYAKANPLNPQKLLEIVAVEVASGINNLACYRTNEGTLFYIKPDLYTGRHYLVGDKDFWIKEVKR